MDTTNGAPSKTGARPAPILAGSLCAALLFLTASAPAHAQYSPYEKAETRSEAEQRRSNRALEPLYRSTRDPYYPGRNTPKPRVNGNNDAPLKPGTTSRQREYGLYPRPNAYGWGGTRDRSERDSTSAPSRRSPYYPYSAPKPEKIETYDAHGRLKGYSKPDYFDETKVEHYDATGRRKGYSKPDYFDKTKTEHYDDYGRLKSYSKPNYFDKSKTEVYDANGRMKGYSKPDYFDKSKTEYFDANGRLLGYSKPDYFDKSKREFFDATGRLIGSRKPSAW